MTNNFDGNYQLFEKKVSVHLMRKIFGDMVQCCLEASKNNKKCPYFDTNDHVYARGVSNALDEVKDVCESLCMSPVFLNSYSVTGLWQKYFNRSGYMKYHIENWYINVIRLEDMFLILINEIFQLGLKKELIGYEIVVTNKNVPDIITKNLKAFHKAVKPIRAARIMLIHHQTLYEEKLYEIQKDEKLVSILRAGGTEKDIEKELNTIEFFTKKFKVPKYRTNKRDYMLKTNRSLLDYVAKMLELLEAPFVKIHNTELQKRKNG